MEFSLFYFSSDAVQFSQNKYQLYLSGAEFADKNGFCAIWTPERHFHQFGGLYASPSVLSSALAMITKNVRLRAGSVVIPLHNPVRLAEEWAIVDNLSQGRVDISFTAGWNKNDFILAPNQYTKRKELLFTGIETIQKLWSGEAVSLSNGEGEYIDICLFPQPQQKKLDVWLTCTSSEERFRDAGEKGFNILTALLFQNLDELKRKISIYHETLKKNGYEPKNKKITLMLHTFIGKNTESVYEVIRKPFTEYLKMSASFWGQQEKNWETLSIKQQEKLLDFAFYRYTKTAALFGTPYDCRKMIGDLQEVGVNEVACLIDFGIEPAIVLDHLQYICELKNM